MSAEADVHADCLRKDGDADVFPEWAATPVHKAWCRLFDGHAAGALSHDNAGLDEVCDEARDLAEWIMTEATPHRRYQALVGVLGFLLLTLVETFERPAPTPTTPE